MDNNVTRIGLVVPPGNVAMERELAMYLADGIAMNVNRLSRPTPAVTKESLLEMINSVDQAVRAMKPEKLLANPASCRAPAVKARLPSGSPTAWGSRRSPRRARS